MLKKGLMLFSLLLFPTRIFGYIEIEKYLDILTQAHPKSSLELSARESANLENALKEIEHNLQPMLKNPSSFRLNESCVARLTHKQRDFVVQLLHALNRAAAKETLRSVHIDPNNELQIQDGSKERLQLGKDTFITWRWQWWGLKVFFSASATGEFCKHTTSILEVLPFEADMKNNMRELACSFSLLDRNKDGLTVNTTWNHIYWFEE